MSTTRIKPDKRPFTLANSTLLCALCALLGFAMGQASMIMKQQASRRPESAEAKQVEVAVVPEARPIRAQVSETPRGSGTTRSVDQDSSPGAKMAARLQEKHFRETTDKEATRYVPFFQSLGLSKEQIQGLMDQMHQFHYSASKINLATQELSMQRDAYDTAVRQMLTPEQFAQYSAFERHRPALKETDAIETFLGQNLKVLTADARKGIADAVEKNNASTIVTWHGPYDPMPKVLVGREIIPFMEERIKRAEVGMEGLLKDLSGAMPADELELIKRYYESKLQEFRESIAMASMTKDQWTEKQQAEIEALMKKALKAP